VESGEPRIALDRAGWLAEILAHSPDVITILGTDGTLLYVNRTLEPFTLEDVLGTNGADFVRPPMRQAWLRSFARAVKEGVTDELEVLGEPNTWWRVRLVPIPQDGEIVAVMTIATDINSEKRASAERARSEAALDLALEASGMGLWRWNVGADAVHWDPVAKKLFGWPLEQERIAYADFLARVVPEDRPRVELHVGTAVSTGTYDDLECRIALPSGESRHILVKGRVLKGADGAATDLLGGVMDVTRKREIELQLARLQKIDAIGQLAGGVAHDFNNLLVAVLGNVDLAERSAEASDRARFLEEVRHAARRAADLTQQLLTFGRRQQLRESSLDLPSLLEDTSRLLERLLPESIEFVLSPAAHVSRIVGDRAQIEQIVMNLCLNARDAMPTGGRLEVRTERFDVTEANRAAHPWAAPGPYAVLTVRDTGTGISAEHLERLFEPFFTTKPQGTGLGLATAWGVAKRHGGHIAVDSELGRGAAFRVYLPLAQPGERKASEALVPPAQGGSETLLVAEDQPEVRKIIVRVLRDAGYHVHVACDGVEAFDKYRQHAAEIRCVLLDAVMPHQGGVDTLTEIRKLSPQLPAIISTGYSDQLPGPASLPGVLFLPKPFDLVALLSVVRAAIDGSS